MKVHYGPCLWLFFGKNYREERGASPTMLQGRPEHTDSVTHDGTWHYQLSGRKIWRLRPTKELKLKQRIEKDKQQQRQEVKLLSGKKRRINCGSDDVDSIHEAEAKEFLEVECKQGDILLLNTRLWWHSTFIPPQEVPCISYARDIYFINSEVAAADTTCKSKIEQQQSSMSNIDGTYAAEDIEADTVLFTEQTMPNCELHRSNKTNANCQVVELEDDKTGESYMAVVSVRDIKAGEFFCILETDDEEDDDSAEGIEEFEEDDS